MAQDYWYVCLCLVEEEVTRFQNQTINSPSHLLLFMGTFLESLFLPPGSHLSNKNEQIKKNSIFIVRVKDLFLFLLLF